MIPHVAEAHQPEKHYSTIVLPLFYHYFSNNKTCYVCNKVCFDCNKVCYDCNINFYGTLTTILISIMIDFIEFIDFIDSILQAVYHNDHTWIFFELILNLFEGRWTQRSCKFELEYRNAGLGVLANLNWNIFQITITITQQAIIITIITTSFILKYLFSGGWHTYLCDLKHKNKKI